MSYDLKIVGGTVIDGTGAPGRRADVAVEGGRIVAVGDCPGTAARTLDAGGALVTPGFVDLHTHYDGQATWDGDLAPSSAHGVTTAVLGNCGVGFAPVRPRDHDRLVRLMEGVEDIPGSALAAGLRWNWESFEQYLDVLESTPHAMNLVAQVPHDALRVYVMGARGAAGEPATEDDVAAMRDLCRAALEAGAAGFSTGRTDNHRTADGDPTPASEASERELVGLARAFEGLGHGVLQAVSDFDSLVSLDRFDAEFDVLEAMARAAGGHTLSLSLLERDQDAEQWRRILGRVEAANAAGLPMRVQVAARPIGVLLGLDATFHPFIGFPSYKAIAHLPLPARVARLRDPAFKARLLAETTDRVAGDGSPIPPLADRLLESIDFVSMRLYPLDDPPDYEPPRERSLFARAMATGRPPLEVVYDALLEDDGRALLYFPLFNYTGQSLDHLHEMLTHPLALAGLSDGGAHVGTICDASFPTYLLSHWTRDRARGPRLPLERAVAMLTGDAARHVGLRDRGVVAPGAAADLNVIEHDRLALGRPRLVADLPGGGKRLLQDAHGYRATVVAGAVVSDDGRLTGARPGTLLRLGHG